jgi:osmoprotectant transport system permease protein
MNVLREVADWFADPARWTGTDGIPNRLVEHIQLSGIVVIVALAVALPLGLYIGHTGRGAIVAIGAANLGRAVPSYALLLVFFPIFGLGFGTAFPALVLLAIPPILTNAYVGLRDVDRDTVESARGMGMTELQLLRSVEVPIALPVIVAGARTAAVQVVATATLAALVAGGGLGRYIVDGFALQDDGRLIGGAVLVALLALATERVFTLIERRLISPGLRGAAPPSGQPYEFAGQAPVPVGQSVPG